MNKGWLRIIVVLVVALITLGPLSIPLARAPTLGNGQLGYSRVIEAEFRPLSSPGLQQLADPIDNLDQFVDTCPTAEDLQHIQSDFAFFLEGNVASSRPYQCSEPVSQMPKESLSETLGVYQALRLILHMKVNQALPWTDLHPYDWLRSKITGVTIRDDTDLSHCCEQVQGSPRTIVLKTLSNDDVEHASEFMMETQVGRIAVGILGFLLLVMHEARHIDPKPHTCACEGVVCSNDPDLQYMGAWAIEYYLLVMMMQNQIGIGLENSRIAGDYILGMADDAHSIAAMPHPRFCSPLPYSSVYVEFQPAAVDIGTTPPGSVKITFHSYPYLFGRSIILMYRRCCGPPFEPWNLILPVYSAPSYHISSGVTNNNGQLELQWIPTETGALRFEAVFPGDQFYASSSVGEPGSGYLHVSKSVWDLSVDPTWASVIPGGSSNFNLQITGTSGTQNVQLAFETVRADLFGFAVTFSTNSQPAPFNSIMTVTVDASKPPGTYDLPFCAGIAATQGTPSGMCLGSDIKWGHVTLTVFQPITIPAMTTERALQGGGQFIIIPGIMTLGAIAVLVILVVAGLLLFRGGRRCSPK